VKFCHNLERQFFQRPDDAIHRGADRQAERDLAGREIFLSNFEPLPILEARALVERVVDLDRDEMIAVLEPGVTWAALRIALRGTGLRVGYPLSPPHSSVLANCLRDGLGNLSLRHGSLGDWLTVLEAVLPLGFVPYKCPAWAWERLRRRLDPGYERLLAVVRGALDPSGILSPRAWRR
jgi:hypothetical protein